MFFSEHEHKVRENQKFGLIAECFDGLLCRILLNTAAFVESHSLSLFLYIYVQHMLLSSLSSSVCKALCRLEPAFVNCPTSTPCSSAAKHVYEKRAFHTSEPLTHPCGSGKYFTYFEPTNMAQCHYSRLSVTWAGLTLRQGVFGFQFSAL